MNTRSIVVAVALLFLCAPCITSAQPLSVSDADPAIGAQLFRTRGCIECHGDVARLRKRRSFYALVAAMWNHFPYMADRVRGAKMKTPYFTSGEMRDLFAFLYSAHPQDLPDVDREPSNSPGEPTRGGQLVAEKGCLGCHSISGAGGPRAGSLDSLKGIESPWSVLAQMWNHLFLMELETKGQGAGWTHVSGDEMADLVAYLRALMRAR